MQIYHYITMLVAGFSVAALVFLFLLYAPFYKEKIRALNYCLLLILLGIVYDVFGIVALLLPEGRLLDGIGVFISGTGLLVNTLFALIVFSLIYGRSERWGRWQKLLFLVPAALLPLYLTNGWHHLLMQSVVKEADGFLFDILPGPLSFVVFAYSTLITLGAVILILRASNEGILQTGRVRAMLVFSTCLPSLFTVLEAVVPLFSKIGISLFSNWTSFFLICYLFFGYLLSVRRTALDFVGDAYVAFDFNDICVDINEEGEAFFLQYCQTKKPSAAQFASLLGAQGPAGFKGGEIHLRHAGQTRYYRVSSFPLNSGLNQHCGNAYILHEITKFMNAMSRLNMVAAEDALTGAKNRRYLDERGPILLKHAAMNETPLSALMVDIDYFKRVNDKYGHPVGDEILKEIYHALQENVRNDDFIALRRGRVFDFK